MAKDPICDMEIDEKEAQEVGLTSEYKGQTYYFCSNQCKDEFDLDPSMYVDSQQQSRAEDDGMGNYPSANE